MAEPIMKRVKGDGIEINLAMWEGAGQSILCIHGITANCRCWDTLAETLAPQHHVMAMDLRGRGQSDRPSQGYSLEYHLQDINCLLDDLDIDRAVIMGHSLGAFIGLAFAAEYPGQVERLILVDGGGDLSQEQLEKVFVGGDVANRVADAISAIEDGHHAARGIDRFLNPDSYTHSEPKVN